MENTPAPVNLTPEQDYDSDFCGSIPLNVVNLIQPHGLLLVLDAEKLHIIQASENVSEHLGTALEDLIDSPFSALLPQEQYQDVLSKVKIKDNQEKIPFSLTLQSKGQERAYTAMVHPEQDYVLVELEESKENKSTFIGLYQKIKFITLLLKQANSTAEATDIAARELKRFSGFDRIMVYQFDPKWNGIVVAQAKEPDMDDYLDLRFPASDVPKQARALYFRNPYRLIPNREYTPVRLLPIINPITQRFTDLTDCSLRSVANVHLEYLQNMGVTASMSLPLIIDDKLWGLIACHHKTAKYPSYELRSALELLSGIISAQISAKEKERVILQRVQLGKVYTRLLEQLYSSHSFAEGLFKGGAGIEQLLGLSGAAVVFEGNVFTSGRTPGKQEVRELVSWLRRNQTDRIFVTDALPQQYAHSRAYKEEASGLIAIAINPDQGEYILGFRPEVLHTVRWGGNPNQAIQMESDGKHYHPRNSFNTYKETVKATSLPWQQQELEVAELLRSAVLEKIIRERY